MPRWRGAAPIQRALLNNDKLTGVTFFKIDEHLDTGKIISSYEYPINESHDTLSLQDDLTSLAIKNIEDIFHKAINHNDFNPQDNNKATYARKLTKEESVISWEEDAISIISKIKAFAGWPGVQAELFKVKFKIIKAHLSAKTSSLDYGSIVTFNHDKFEIQDGCDSSIETYSCRPGVLIHIFHTVGFGMIPMTKLVTITNNSN